MAELSDPANASSACPVFPKLKEILGLDILSTERHLLKSWYCASDGEQFLQFDGVVRVTFTQAPNGFIILQFYRVWHQSTLPSRLRKSETVGYCLWDCYGDADPVTGRAPIRLGFTNDVGEAFFGLPAPQGRLMSELCPEFYETLLPEMWLQARTTGHRVQIEESELLTTSHRNGPDVARVADIIWDVEIIPVTKRVVLCSWKDVSSVILDRAAQQRLSILLNASPSLCLLARPGTLSVVYINSAGRNLAHLGPEDQRCSVSVADLFPDLVHKFDGLEENQVVHVQTTLRSTTGVETPVMASFVTYTEDLRYTREPSPPKFLAIFARPLSEEMERRERLERDIIAAQASASAKSDFLATMSHEIRTPLHGIVGSAVRSVRP